MAASPPAPTGTYWKGAEGLSSAVLAQPGKRTPTSGLSSEARRPREGGIERRSDGPVLIHTSTRPTLTNAGQGRFCRGPRSLSVHRSTRQRNSHAHQHPKSQPHSCRPASRQRNRFRAQRTSSFRGGAPRRVSRAGLSVARNGAGYAGSPARNRCALCRPSCWSAVMNPARRSSLLARSRARSRTSMCR
jgi:hypothetical protein